MVERFRGSTGGGVDFASPAGRVCGWRRAAPSAFVVAAADRPVAEGRALRADTKRRGAPFTNVRWRGTRKASELGFWEKKAEKDSALNSR